MADAATPLNQIDKRPGEKVHSHRAFLLWLMQAPSKRSIRATARAVGKSDTALNGWKLTFGWVDREKAIGVGADSLAARAYAARYHSVKGMVEVSRIIHLMAVEYVGPQGNVPTPVKQPTTDTQKEEAVRETKAKAEDLTNKQRLAMLLDAAEGRLAEALKDNKVRVNVADLATLVRLRKEVHEGPTAAQIKDPLATSIRVEDAAKAGIDALVALQEDLAEMALIVSTLQVSQAESNVLPFPGGQMDMAREGAG